MPSFEPVRAIFRGLEALRIVSECGPITAVEVARTTGLPTATAIRILETLVNAGYVYKQSNSARYLVTARTRILSRGFDERSLLIEKSTPAIDELRDTTGWPLSLPILEGDAMTVAYTTRRGITLPDRLGVRIPLLGTGAGIVYLAHLSPEQTRAVLDRIEQSSDAWDREPGLWENIDERIDDARREGYAFANDRYLESIYQSQIWAVSVPIVANDRFVAGLSSLVPRGAGPKKRILPKLLPAMRRTAAAISESLS